MSFQGFEEFLYKWHWDQRKIGKLLRNDGNSGLGDFLEQNNLNSLLWLNQINTGEFSKAHTTLEDLAVRETSLLARKKVSYLHTPIMYRQKYFVFSV